MTPDRLLTYFDRIADAPDAIAHLRRFILDLAVLGKLVEQDQKDEPASELLKQIRAEKLRLTKEGKIKKEKALQYVEDDAAPFGIPRTWRWTRLGEVTELITKGSSPKWQGIEYTSKDDGVLFITSENVGNYDLRKLDDLKYVERRFNEIEPRSILQFGDVLMNLVGASIGRTAIYNLHVEANINQAVALIRLIQNTQNLSVPFLLHYLNSPSAIQQMLASQVITAQPNISLTNAREFPIPVPPLAEQHRIVAKVDELMALCDRLEAVQAERERRRDRLAAASLHRLNNGVDASDFRPHARFHLDHLARFTTRPDQISQLRDTILQLAVTGRLSEQLAIDGNGEDLLRRMGKARRNKRKDFDATSESNEPLPTLPKSWTWAIIDQVAAEDANAITDGPFGANLKTAHYVETPGYRVIRLQNIGRGHFRKEHRSYIDKERFERLVKHHVFAGDLIVAGLVDPYVRCCEVPLDIGPALVKADCYRFKVHPSFSARFALYYLNSLVCQGFAAVHHHGMTLVRIGLGNFRLIPIPVPPLAEQQRIVAKVEELLALCDQLEAQLTNTQTESRRLLEAVLNEALHPNDRKDV